MRDVALPHIDSAIRWKYLKRREGTQRSLDGRRWERVEHTRVRSVCFGAYKTATDLASHYVSGVLQLCDEAEEVRLLGAFLELMSLHTLLAGTSDCGRFLFSACMLTWLIARCSLPSDLSRQGSVKQKNVQAELQSWRRLP